MNRTKKRDTNTTYHNTSPRATSHNPPCVAAPSQHHTHIDRQKRIGSNQHSLGACFFWEGRNINIMELQRRKLAFTKRISLLHWAHGSMRRVAWYLFRAATLRGISVPCSDALSPALPSWSFRSFHLQHFQLFMAYHALHCSPTLLYHPSVCRRLLM